MSQSRPDFIESEYFYIDDEGWHLKENAPEDMKKEFEEYTKEKEFD